MDQETLASRPEGSTSGRRSFFLRQPQFSLLWSGQTLSKFGSYISLSGLPLIAIQFLQASPLQLGLLVACNSLPVLLISLFAGVWIDRLPRRPVMMLADLGRAALLCTIPLLYLSGVLRIEALYVVTLVVSVCTIFFEVAFRSLLPALLQGDDLIVGNGRLGVSDALAEIAGPPFASWLLQLLRAPLALLIDASTFVISACCIWRLRFPEHPVAPLTERSSIWHDLRDGLRFLLGQPKLRAIAAYTALFNFCGGTFATLYMLYLLRTLRLSLLGYGLVVMMGGVGNLLGAWLAIRVARRFGPGRSMIGATLLFGVMAVVTALAAGPTWIVVAILMLTQLTGDCALTIYIVNEISWRQSTVPEVLQGRINSCMHLLQEGIGPLGAIVAALFSQLIHDIRLTLVCGAIGMTLASFCLLLSPWRRQYP
ncbi:MFS transporter [Dictyobacter aurantiacus]|uniref:MFS transporter n=1 Tax=Dictyobacter aurantiacus TaxID=1936993 RepID=A0A401ZC42_9CHLR|nr:MFS transporter [Dictyobacter aurantiacus]GCE04396.1 MFS transporter [Dictyobacter aurantiacus]